MLSELIREMGHRPIPAYSITEGMKALSSSSFDVVFLDVRLPDGNGLNAIPNIRKSRSNPEIIIMTAFGDPGGAELAIRCGVWDYIEKPSSIHMIMLPLARALQYREASRATGKNSALKRNGIIGSSSAMMVSFDLLAKAAQANTTVLITGETGTGKELFAQAIHENSSRCGKKIVTVDCAGLKDTLVESILFGYEKGSFTGAEKSRDGLIIEANRGTLFLDEVGELPLAIQKNFLRVLQERCFRPVGGKSELQSDFRLIAATNRNLEEMVRQGEFRGDLLYRLRGFTIELPPLRERPDDVRDLSLFYIGKFCERLGMEIKGLSPEFFEALISYPWPGNVRELFNTLESALAVAGTEPTLFCKHLPNAIRIWLAKAEIQATNASLSGKSHMELPSFQKFRSEMDLRYFQDLMTSTRNDAKEATKISGLSRSRFYALLKKYEISPAL
jgi:two-component system NtrC family response regulator